MTPVNTTQSDVEQLAKALRYAAHRSGFWNVPKTWDALNAHARDAWRRRAAEKLMYFGEMRNEAIVASANVAYTSRD